MSKRKAKDKSQSNGAEPPADSPDFPFPFGPNMMKEIMNQLFDDMELSDDEEDERKALTKDKKSPLAKAQKLVYKAEETFDPIERESLVRKALKTCPDCADAYAMLADHVESEDEALDLYRQGVAAGERTLGAAFFEEATGECWDYMAARPYMRARMGLALQLWQTGQHDECLGHLRALLRLNSGDDQGARYYLATYLLQLGHDRELGELLEEHDDPTADWLFHKAILAFRIEGDTPRSRELLQEADKFNSHVAAYMVDFRTLPLVLPEFTQFGDEGEAMHYTANNRAGWKTTAGAIPWLRKVLNPEIPPEEFENYKPRRPKPQKINFDDLAELPQSDEVWQVDLVCAPIELEAEKDRLDQWIWIVATTEDETLLDHELLDEKLGAGFAFERLCRLMFAPKEGDACRPARIETRLKSFAKSWAPKFERIGVACQLVEELEVTEGFVEQLNTFVAESEGRVGVTPTIDDLLQLPQIEGNVWQIDCRQLPTWIHEAGEPFRPWMLVVANATDGTIVGQNVSFDTPANEDIWRTLACALARPHMGEPQRPGRLELTSPSLRATLLPELGKLGIQCGVRDNLEKLDFLFQDIGQHLTGKSAIPAILDSPGMALEQVGDYFSAAADFFRWGPWRKVRGDAAIKIECPKFQNNTWYAVVMGQSGITIGLALYNCRDMLDEILCGRPTAEPSAAKMTGLSLVYGEAFEMSPIDVEACERFGWSLATTEAYPHAMWLNPGMVIRAPLTWELELLTASLRAIPEFLESKTKSPTTIHAPTVNGKLECRMSWVVD